MTAMLTFYPRRALLEATGSGRSFSVPTYRDPAKVAAWAKTRHCRREAPLVLDRHVI